MSDSEPSPRPRQLTMAGAFVIGGSVLVVFAAFDALANLQSVDTRNEVARMVDSATGEGLGLSVSEALSGMRVGLMVAAVCAAVSGVLGIYALQRHRGARVALSVLAVPILLTSPLTGGIPGALVVLATLMLWSGPVRDWFDGRPVRQPVTRERPPEQQAPRPTQPPTQPPPQPPAPTLPPAPDVSTERPSSVPAATPGYGQSPAHQQAPASTLSWGPPQQQLPPGRATGAVPRQVKVACVLTWTFSGVVALLYAGVMVALVVAQDTLVDYVVEQPAWERAELQSDLILPVLWVGCLLFFAWSAGAVVLAVFTWKRHNWARYLLIASAGAAIVAGLFAFPLGLPHQIAAAVTIAGLLSAPARAWFAGPSQGYGPPPGPPPGSTWPPPGQEQRPPADRSGNPPVW